MCKCFYRALVPVGILMMIASVYCSSDLPRDRSRRGILRDLPATPTDAFAHFKRREIEAQSDASVIHSVDNLLTYIRARNDFIENEHRIDKRNIFQLPTILTSKNVSQQCIQGFLMAVPALLDVFFGEIPFWPLNLVDSTGKSAIGSLRGTRRMRGNMHGCISIKAKAPKILQKWINPINFTGKFCHIIAEYGSENYIYHTENEVIPPSTTTRRILDTEICFPSVCSDEDVIDIVETFSNELVYDEFEITHLKCITTDKGPLSSWTTTVIVICSIWAAVLLIGSAFDLIQEFIHSRKKQNWLDPSKLIEETVAKPPEHGRFARVLLSLSIPRNFGYLLDNPIDYPSDEIIPAIGGIRFFTFIWFQVTTIYIIAIKLPWGNYSGILEDLRTTNFQWIINGRFAPETTFCLSGFLSGYVTLRYIDRNGGHLNFLRYYLRRYLRLAPSYLLVMLLTTAFFWYSYDEGPEWVTKHQFEDACRHHWWKGLLFINNFFKDAETCPPISWYFAVDMQLHLIAPFIIYILYNNRRVGIWVTIISIITFISIPPLMTASQHLPFFIGRLFYFEENHQQYIDLILHMPYSHAGPFLIGLLFGYMLFVNGIKPTMRKSWVILCWLLSVTVISVIIYGFYPYTDGTADMSMVLGLLYTTLTPSLWALAIGWILYACATGYGWVINGILSLNIFSNFNRLSYCCYLAQALTIKHFLFSRPDPLYYEPWMMLLIVNGTTIMAIFAGIAISVAVERPCLELQRALSYESISEQNARVDNELSEDDEEKELINGAV